MNTLTKKTVQTTRELTYTYYINHPSPIATTNRPRPTLFFLHGFPDDASLWSEQILYFTSLNYPIIAPNLLGYEGCSQPSELEAYNSKGIADDYVDILDAEGVQEVIIIGHDYGAAHSYKMGIWYPERILGTVSLAVGDAKSSPAPAGGLDMFIKMVGGLMGYENFSYIRFFTSPDAPQVIDAHTESFFCAMYGKDQETWKYHLSHGDALRKFVEEGKTHPVHEWAEGSFHEKTIERWKRSGFVGMLKGYHLFGTNIHWEKEKDLPESRFYPEYPGLYIGGTEDSVCGTFFADQMKTVRKDLVIKWMDSGHWIMREKPHEVNSIIEQWLEERF